MSIGESAVPTHQHALKHHNHLGMGSRISLGGVRIHHLHSKWLVEGAPPEAPPASLHARIYMYIPPLFHDKQHRSPCPSTPA